MFGLALALSFVALLVLLPLLTSARLLRLSREVNELRDRLHAIEELLRRRAPMPASPQTQAASLMKPDAGDDGVARMGASGAVASAAAEAALVDRGGARAMAEAPTVTAESAASDNQRAQPRNEQPAPPFEPGASVAPAPPFEPGARVAAGPAVDDEDLEGRIGGRWLLYTGVLVLLLGVSFFLKYAFDNEWINETGRIVAGIAAGVALVAGGSRLAARGLGAFGQALIGTGLAILYLSVYAALTFYALIGNTTAFAMMLLVTVAAGALAEWQRAQALAFIAVGGGFLTPFLVGGTTDAHLALFTYDALLIGGTMLLAQRHDWLALNAVSYVFTIATVLAWGAAFYRDSLWLRTLLFLTLYCVMFLQILRDTRRSQTPLARAVALLLATAPLLYHVVAVVLTAQHPPAIHVYLIAFTVVGLWLTADPHRPAVRLLVLGAGYVPLLGTLTLPDGLSWIGANTVTIVAVAGLHLLAPLDRVFRQHDTLARSELVALHLVLIGLYGLLHETLAASYPELRGVLGGLLALVALALWRTLHTRDRVASINACALAFTLGALAIAVQFDGPAVVVGWAAEGAAAAWIGVRVSNRWVQLGGLLLWALAAVRMLDGYFDTPARFSAIFNARAATTAFVVVVGYSLAWLVAKHSDRVAHAERTRAALHVAASLLTMIWITAEVSSYWEVRYATPQAYLYEQLILSLAWGIYGALLIVVGMRRAYAPDRYVGITVLGVTILKVFFSDLWELGGIYRVIGFLAFGILLVAVSYLYQKRLLRASPDATPPLEASTAPPERP